MAKGKSCQIGSSTLGLGLCLVMFGCTLILVPVIVGNSVEVKKRSLDICKDVSCPPGQHCCEDRDRCGGNECEECVDGTFSPGGDAICENCNQCEIGTKKLENCTRAKDTVCSNCSAGNFRSSSGRCISCTSCNGEDHCVDICTTTPMKKTPTMSTINQPAIQMTSASTTPEEKTMMSSAIPSTTSQDKILLEKSWMESTGKILIPVLVIFIIIAIVIAVGCLYYRKKSKKYSKCNNDSNGTVYAAKSANDIEVKFDNQQNSGETEKGIEVQPQVPKKELEKQTNNPSGIQLLVPLQKPRRNSYRRTSLITLPEGEPLLHNQDMPSSLPDWCLKDKTIVPHDVVGPIADLIGKKGARLGKALGLHTGIIENCEYNHKDDLARQNFEIIQSWLTKNGIKATKCKLAKALVDVERLEAAYLLWPDREITPVTPTTPVEGNFWQRRKSNSDNFKIDTRVLDKMDFTQRNSWCLLINNVKENDVGNLEELEGVCGLLATKLKKLVPLTQCQSPSDFAVDSVAKSLMEDCNILKQLTAVKVTADGNCLFSSVSILVCGSEDRCTELRLRTVIELIKHKDHYLKQAQLIECIKYEYALTNMEDDDGLIDIEIEAHFDGSVRDTLKDGEPAISLQGNSILLFGLASVLGCNIQSVYPTSDSSPLNILIQSRRKIENPVTAYIMWSMHKGLSEEGQNFVPNHFVPLLKEQN